MELNQLQIIIRTSKLSAPFGREAATRGLLEAARCVGWENDTCPIISEVCCPAYPAEQQMWVSGARFSAVLVWNTTEYRLFSCTLLGTLAFFASSPRGTGRAALTLGWLSAEDLPMGADRFRQLLAIPGNVPPARWGTVLAGFYALHDVFAVSKNKRM